MTFCTYYFDFTSLDILLYGKQKFNGKHNLMKLHTSFLWKESNLNSFTCDIRPSAIMCADMVFFFKLNKFTEEKLNFLVCYALKFVSDEPSNLSTMVDVTAQQNEIDEIEDVALGSDYSRTNDPIKQTDKVRLTIHL